MRQVLKLHPESCCRAVTSIEVEVIPGSGTLLLRYLLWGTPGDVRLPPAATRGRADELWRHTCFEAFLRAPPRAAYYEFNFAPSRQWAAYRFTGTRQGMRRAGEIRPPQLAVRVMEAGLELQAVLALERLAILPGDADWHLGLSAVIEETDGDRSYWALAHPPGKPDFHHSGSFACKIPATERP